MPAILNSYVLNSRKMGVWCSKSCPVERPRLTMRGAGWLMETKSTRVNSLCPSLNGTRLSGPTDSALRYTWNPN